MSEVGEDRGVESDPLHALLGQGVRRDLQRSHALPAVARLREQAL